MCLRLHELTHAINVARAHGLDQRAAHLGFEPTFTNKGLELAARLANRNFSARRHTVSPQMQIALQPWCSFRG